MPARPRGHGSRLRDLPGVTTADGRCDPDTYVRGAMGTSASVRPFHDGRSPAVCVVPASANAARVHSSGSRHPRHRYDGRLSTARCCSSRRARETWWSVLMLKHQWPNASPAAGRWLPSTTGLVSLFDALFEPACMYVQDWVVSWDGDGQHHDASRVPLRTRPPGRRVTSGRPCHG